MIERVIADEAGRSVENMGFEDLFEIASIVGGSIKAEQPQTRHLTMLEMWKQILAYNQNHLHQMTKILNSPDGELEIVRTAYSAVEYSTALAKRIVETLEELDYEDGIIK